MVDVKEIRLRSPHWQASDTVSTLSLLIPLKREKKVVESKGMEEKEGNRKKKNQLERSRTRMSVIPFPSCSRGEQVGGKKKKRNAGSGAKMTEPGVEKKVGHV